MLGAIASAPSSHYHWSPAAGAVAAALCLWACWNQDGSPACPQHCSSAIVSPSPQFSSLMWAVPDLRPPSSPCPTHMGSRLCRPETALTWYPSPILPRRLYFFLLVPNLKCLFSLLQVISSAGHSSSDRYRNSSQGSCPYLILYPSHCLLSFPAAWSQAWVLPSH